MPSEILEVLSASFSLIRHLALLRFRADSEQQATDTCYLWAVNCKLWLVNCKLWPGICYPFWLPRCLLYVALLYRCGALRDVVTVLRCCSCRPRWAPFASCSSYHQLVRRGKHLQVALVKNFVITAHVVPPGRQRGTGWSGNMHGLALPMTAELI